MNISSLQFLANDYLNALVIFLGFFLLAKIFLYITEKVIKLFTSKTKTQLDDLILERTRIPLSFILLLIGLRLALLALHIQNTLYDYSIKAINSLLVLLVTYIVVTVVVILIRAWGERWAKRTATKADDQLVIFFVKVTKVTGWIIGFLYMLTVWGIQIGPLLASLGVAGVAVAFALQQSLGNVFGGISLLVDRAIKVDDIIELEDGTSGKVIDIGIRSTKIRTWDNEVIIVPNGQLANGRLKNIVLPEPKVRVVVPFSVAYGSDIEQVKKIVLKEVKKVEGFIPDPKPFVMFLEMADSSLNFKAYFWVESYSMRFSAKDQANTLIYNALNKAGIEIPFPQMDLHVRDMPEEKKKR